MKQEPIKYPVLKGFERQNKFISVWCPECRQFHQHGQGQGHRTEHCDENKESKYHNGGYIIEVFTKQELKQFLPYIKETLQGVI